MSGCTWRLWGGVLVGGCLIWQTLSQGACSENSTQSAGSGVVSRQEGPASLPPSLSLSLSLSFSLSASVSLPPSLSLSAFLALSLSLSLYLSLYLSISFSFSLFLSRSLSLFSLSLSPFTPSHHHTISSSHHQPQTHLHRCVNPSQP